MLESHATIPPLPSMVDLGVDLLHVSVWRRSITLAIPFVCVAAYGLFAIHRLWMPAVLCLIYLSFATYGSISHDLVHHTLALPSTLNEFFLATIELLAFRSGHAYRMAHLHHHARFPHEDDIEGAAAKMTLFRAILEGMIFQPRIMIWALRRPHRSRPWIVFETAMVVLEFTISVATVRLTPIFAVYAVLMTMGSWIIPLVTSYIPHNAIGENALSQTILFRGKVLSIIALEHLYHLEHHLYPMVPHHNWPKLAKRLDPYFKRAGVVPVILGF